MECPVHNDKIVMVCLTCANSLLCPECRGQHDGHKVLSTKKAVDVIKDQLRERAAKNSEYLEHLEEGAVGIVAKRKELSDIDNAEVIETQKRILLNTINISADKLLIMYKTQTNRNLTTLQEREELLSTVHTETVQYNQKIEDVLKIEKSSKFLKQLKLLHPPQRVDTEVPPLPSSEFHVGEIDERQISAMIGAMSTDNEKDSDFYGALRCHQPLEVETTFICDDLSIADHMHASVNNHSWIRWSHQSCIKLTNKDGNVKQIVDFTGAISGMCVTPDNRILVCDFQGKRIHNVLYGCGPSVFMKTKLHPLDVCFTEEDDVIVALIDNGDYALTRESRRVVQMFDSHQREKSCSEYDQFGDRLYINPGRICVHKNTIVVVNKIGPNSSHLVVLDKRLTLRLRYLGFGEIIPADSKFTVGKGKMGINDVCFSPTGNILITEVNSRSIQMLDSECRHLKTLWKDDSPPTCLCVQPNGSVWCSFKNKDQCIVKTFKYA